jgi:thiol:disulfide interchange protein
MPRPRPVRLFSMLLLLALGSAAPALAQGLLFGGAAEKVELSLATGRAFLRAGEKVDVIVTARIEPGWHIYSMTPAAAEMAPQPTTITINAPGLTRAGPVRQPEPRRKMDEAFGMVVELFEGEVSFAQTFSADSRAPGPVDITAAVRFMACDDKTCLPPTTVNITGSLTIEAGPARDGRTPSRAGAEAVPARAPISERPTRSIDDARAKGFIAYLGFAVSMGFLALLTPCVFPMIPITVSFFTKKEGLTRAQGLTQAVIYCAGIIATFTALGILLAVLFGAASIQGVAANIWVNLAIAGVFTVFALNLFGAFEIRVPYKLVGFLGDKSGQGAGTLGTILMGLTFSLTSFTCTVPFVGTVLVAATQGELFWSITGMLGFSAAFASPFFLLALFPQLLASLPKSGGWLNSVKVIMGFLELAAAMKFLSNIDLVMGWGVLPRELFLAGWIAIAGVAGYYLFGKFRLPHDTPTESVGVPRLMFGMAFFSIAIYLATGLSGQPLGEIDAFLPPYAMADRNGGGTEGATTSHDAWLQSYPEALAAARQSGQPIFVDFTGVTCTNCRLMEKNIFARQDVAAIFDDFVLVQLWTDLPTEQSRANQVMQQQRFGTVALPYYAVITPDDKILDTFEGFTRDAEEFKRFLTDALAAHRATALGALAPDVGGV